MRADRSAPALPIGAAESDRLLAPLLAAARILLAVSGGPDSMALLRLAAAWRERLGGPPTAVATVDHGLRPEARREAELVAAASGDLGLPHAILDWQGVKPKSRVQEAARNARYALLAAHAEGIGASHLVTAHTLDDQAETILFRLARGSGPKGLVGMRASLRRGALIHLRPLLGVRKARLVATCRAMGCAYVEDPSNDDPRFARTRWRAAMALLAREGATPERLAVLASRLGRAEAALDAAAEAAGLLCLMSRDDGQLAFDGARLAAEPAEIVLRVVGGALDEVAVRDASQVVRLERLERLCAELTAALRERRTLRRTLGGALVWTRSDGSLMVARERHRGRKEPQAAGDRNGEA